MIKINNYYKSSYNRPGSDAPRKILGILAANKCKKIIDFGVWNGGSVILSAKSLQGFDEKEENDLESYDFDFSPEGLQSALEKLHSGERVTIKTPGKSSSKGEIHVYDLTWGDPRDNRSDHQSGNFYNVIDNLRKEECFSGITYIFQKYDYHEWIKRGDDKDFDFMHVDLCFSEHEGGDKFRDHMIEISQKIKKDAIICFMYKNKNSLYVESLSKMISDNIKIISHYEDILNKLVVFDETFPGFCTFSNSDFKYKDLEVAKVGEKQFVFYLDSGEKE